MHPMRRKERQMQGKAVENLLHSGEYGVLACEKDGIPYAVPVNYIYQNGAIYFHCATEGRKIDYFSTNKRVCFTVVGESKVIPDSFTSVYSSVIAEGEISNVTDEKEKRDALFDLVKKYSPMFLNEGMQMIEKSAGRTSVFRITVNHVVGKSNPY